MIKWMCEWLQMHKWMSEGEWTNKEKWGLLKTGNNTTDLSECNEHFKHTTDRQTQDRSEAITDGLDIACTALCAMYL